MTVQALHPYLVFNGEAEQAITFYQQVFGARVDQLARFAEVPGMQAADEHKQRVMHCQLSIGAAVFMVSDSMPSAPAPRQSNIHVVLHLSDERDLHAKFAALAEGGKVSFPVHDAFFGGKFGMLVDKFGVDWMLSWRPA